MAEPPLRKRKPKPRSVVVAAMATAPLTTAGVVTAAPASAADSCDNGAVMPLGKYYVGDNLWGQNSVKPYAGAVLGRHWGRQRSGTGLPVRIGDHRPVRANWSHRVTQDTPNVMNVAYDLWLHNRPDPGRADQPTDEVMVWTYRSGGAGPVGSKVETLSVGGAT